MLLRKDNRAAGELEGVRPASSWIIVIKNVRYGLFDERSEIFREDLSSQKMWRLLRAKKSLTFLTRCGSFLYFRDKLAAIWYNISVS